MTPNKAWTRLIKTPQAESVNALVVDSSEFVYVSGYTEGNLDGNSAIGSNDAFVSKFDSNGNKIWTRLIGSSQSDVARSISIAADGSIFVVGETRGDFDGNANGGSSDVFISRLSGDGLTIWTRYLGSVLFDRGNSVSISLDGSVYVAGITFGNLEGEAGSGQADAFLVKFNQDGTKSWTRVLGTSWDDFASCSATDNEGSVYVAGGTSGSLEGNSNFGSSDAFIAKYDSSGNLLWTRTLGSFQLESASSIIASNDGYIYVGGSTRGNLDGNSSSGKTDGFVAKFTKDGKRIWTRLVGTAADDSVNALIPSLNGGVYASGSTGGELNGQLNNGQSDAYVLSLDSAGNHQWTNVIGSTQDDAAFAAGTLDGASAYISGSTFGNFDGISGSGFPDGFVTKYLLNQAPTGLTFTSVGIAENSAAGSVIGTLSAEDPDAGSTFTYALVAGTGDTDNNLVEIVGDEVRVKTGASIDYETNPELILRIQVTDNGTPGLSYSKAITASVLDVNETPTDLSFTSSGIAETSAAGTVIGTLSATDPDAASSFSFALVAGDGSNDADNNLVEIVGNEVRLKTGAALDHETNPTLNLNIQVTDDGTPALSYTKAVTAAVSNGNEAPTDLTFTSVGIAENSAAGSVIGTLSAEDPDAGSTFTYALVAGTGDTDNNLVEIVGDEVRVKTGASIDYETNPELNLRIQVTDNGTPGLSYSKAVTASVLDVNETPTDLSFTSSSFDENIPAGSMITTISSVDEDSSDAQVYSLARGDGSKDDKFFQIDDNRLKIKISPDYETKSSYSIRVEAKDSGGLSFEKSFTLQVNDVINETIRSTKSRALRGNELNLILTGSAAINGTGNNLNNRLTGNAANNVLNGRGGRDVMAGRKGNDTYIVNHIKDVVSEGKNAGTDTVKASVSHTLKANVERLVLTGRKAINGTGNNLNNRLTGNAANNVLNGRRGRDRIIGRTGDDSLIGGTGTDTMSGGLGADVFIYRSFRDSGIGGAKRDVITDFRGSIGDRIDLSAIDTSKALSGDQAFTFIGSDPFSGTQAEVRFESGILQANTGSDKSADMEIFLRGVASFDASHLFL